jgi:hypothetical protein
MTSKPTASGGAGGSECSRAAELQAALVDQTAPGAGDHRQVQKSAPGVIEERPLTHGVIEQPVLLDRDHRDVVAGTPHPCPHFRAPMKAVRGGGIRLDFLSAPIRPSASVIRRLDFLSVDAGCK